MADEILGSNQFKHQVSRRGGAVYPSSLMSETQAAWLAGYLDGDGSVALVKASRPGRKTPITRIPQVMLYSCDIELVDYAKSLVGGCIQRKSFSKSQRRQQFHWRLHGAGKTLALLERVFPYLRCEK
jgi:hypothetical protein